MGTALLDLIKRRRTVRKFADEDVTDDQLRSLLEAAVSAPTRYDTQPWHFVVLRDKPLQKRLAEAMRVHAYIETAPVLLAVWGEPERTPTWLMDCSAAIENLLLAATALGLGGAWVGGPGSFGWDAAEAFLRWEIAAPPEVRLVSLVALGVPVQVPPPHGDERWDPRRLHLRKWDQLWP